ncbi:MAG TPA: hypothetical protein VL405_05510 [Sphingomonas sp.]|nr:hypothetical protein [Sphingomonas sp.]
MPPEISTRVEPFKVKTPREWALNQHTVAGCGAHSEAFQMLQGSCGFYPKRRGLPQIGTGVSIPSY